MSRPTRRVLLAGGAACLAAPYVARAAEPDFRLKLGNIVSADHPLNVAMARVRDRVARETDGKVMIELFPKNQLGSDADMLSQLRSGALELFAQTGVLMSTLVPVASISGVGFAFPTYDKVWEALDGPLGRHVRGAFEKANLVCMEKSYNHGFRQTTSSTKPIRTPNDFSGFKIRVPPSPLWTSMFKSFGAAPVSIPWAETYSAMQTRIADGLEQPLIGLLVDKMYEVQKYCSLTNHMWDGFWVLANRKAWERIPPNLRDILERNINEEALVQRREVEHMNATLQSKLQTLGLQFFEVENAAFRDRLVSSGFYQEWRKRYGDEAWGLLEATTGKLG
ncbi:TRAP transporter substrate-binding protein [Methylobacterium frigidaeris]|uniref:2,3-diketo-L-gulonate-binding periplasmic protein YiaO n=1 Tax=Methylobacterium frigidaeris TaxID=2038277 RepID=A0AA37HHF0_9HYPH|nr:TRAP transporter substrate-binding protein [Methylobacterium frigidaeris]PIK71551.1 ABC transporter substrate-binding protein [Methylobacterium frigidaeris]GJD65614.1 2,3-diketo-L-gulonate-binding periplasmic protein YiaO [Methylobacterium frigidaeris]